MKFIYRGRTSKIKLQSKIIDFLLNNVHKWGDWQSSTWGSLSNKTWQEMFENWNIEE